MSTQHRESATNDILRPAIKQLILDVIPAKYIDDKTIFHVNPSGKFVMGGPLGDAGVTGRKIIVDTYGGWGAHGGGAFSGKDPTKVDRSAAYAARWVAKSARSPRGRLAMPFMRFLSCSRLGSAPAMMLSCCSESLMAGRAALLPCCEGKACLRQASTGWRCGYTPH